MFFAYACNHFNLRDVEEEYRKYGASREDERKWRQEFINFWISRLSVDDLTALNCLDNAGATEALPQMIRIAPLGDDYAKLWYGNAIWGLANNLVWRVSAKEASFEAGAAAVRLWQSAIEGTITIPDEHRGRLQELIDSFPALGVRQPTDRDGNPVVTSATTPEEYVYFYAMAKLREAEKCSLQEKRKQLERRGHD